MVDLIKEIVSGKKRRYKEDGFNLDLTYITDRIIAMAFPGSGLERVYRNNIDDVVKLLERKHGKKYMVINLSGRHYDYEKFNNQVIDFEWENHHSPPISHLFEICRRMNEFLKKDENNVIAVHCIAGKGRTGSIITCFLMFCGRFDNSAQALEFYKRTRFKTGGGVTQPSQVRYIRYFEKILHGYTTSTIKMAPVIVKLKSLIIHGCPKISSKYFRPIAKIYSVKNQIQFYSSENSEKKKNKKYYFEDLQKENLATPIVIDFEDKNPIYVVGDILIKVYHIGTLNTKLAFRFSFNTFFLGEGDHTLTLTKNELDPDSIAVNDNYPDNIKVELVTSIGNLTEYDKITNELLKNELENWQRIDSVFKDHKFLNQKEASVLIFKDLDRDSVEHVLSQKKPMRNSDEKDSNEPSSAEDSPDENEHGPGGDSD